MISLKKLQLNYRLNLESLTFEEGKINIIIGPNGAGKSTLLEILSKNVDFVQGDVFISGRSLKEIPLAELSQVLSYIPQKLNWNPALLVAEIILFGLYPFSKSDRLTGEDSERLSYLEKAFELSDLLSRPFGELSGGEQKRVAIASAFFQNTKIIIMDEPFAALDPLYRGRVADILKKWQRDHDVTMILSVHDLYSAHHLGDSFIGLKHGHLVAHKQELDQDFLESLFDITFTSYKVQTHKVFLPDLGESDE